MAQNKEAYRQDILSGRTSLGIELGSTRIKAVLIAGDHTPIAQGGHNWENKLVDGVWTYDLDDVWRGLQDCYAKLAADVQAQYGLPLATVGALGISAMMHGYLVFDKEGKQLVPFRTWRNTMTAEASEKLVELFGYPIPHRWSIAHLYQAILNNEEHVPNIAHITTLAGYVHWRLTGEKLLGVGDASGMFPIDTATKQYNREMIHRFQTVVQEKGYGWTLDAILPAVKLAGESAGVLTEEGASLLDVSGALKPGAALCAPEGDAGTGMAATNSVAPRTGNVSAGTSIFLMAVLEKELARPHPEIDLVTTPAGDLVAMVHCNNCTGDIDAWARVFAQFAEACGHAPDMPKIYDSMYFSALQGDVDGGGLVACNYLSGESITALDKGVPHLLRPAGSVLSFANLMRTNLYSALATLRIGLDILQQEEDVCLEKVVGHGGLFKTERVGQQMMAAAVNAPVTVMATAGEGGPWGMALLAAYMRQKEKGESLQQYLRQRVFHAAQGTSVAPQPADVQGFAQYMARYKMGLTVEKKAVEIFD